MLRRIPRTQRRAGPAPEELTASGEPDTHTNDLQVGHCGLACPMLVRTSQEVKDIHEGASQDGPVKQAPLKLSLSPHASSLSGKTSGRPCFTSVPEVQLLQLILKQKLRNRKRPGVNCFINLN